MRTILKSSRATILLTSTVLITVAEAKSALSNPAAEPTPNVELNTNINGCADLQIVSSSVRGKNVSMKVKIIDTTDATPKIDYPCICSDVSTYYFMVFPLDQFVRQDGVMMAKMKPFTKNLGVTRHEMAQKKEYVETTEFPFVKNKQSKPFSHYYISFACRGGGP